MTRYFLLIWLLILIGMAACAPVMPAPAATDSPVATIQAHEGFYPLSTRTGTAEIDTVLEAVASGNVGELRPLIQFTSLGCTLQDGLGGPPKCREGEVEGTPVAALPFLGSEGSFLRRDALQNWRGIDVSGLYAVYEHSAEVYEDKFYPAGEQTILLENKSDGQPIALRLFNGRIVRIDYLASFGMESLENIIQREVVEVILAPASR